MGRKDKEEEQEQGLSVSPRWVWTEGEDAIGSPPVLSPFLEPLPATFSSSEPGYLKYALCQLRRIVAG